MEQRLCIAVCMPAGLIEIGLRTVLQRQEDLQLVFVTHQYNDLIQLCKQHRPALVLFFSSPSQTFHMTLLEEYYQLLNTPLLVLSPSYSKGHFDQLWKVGVQGYFLVGHDDDLLLHAMRTLFLGDSWFSPTITGQLLNPSPLRASSIEFTKREIRILRLMVQGLSNRQISQMLNVTERTVRFHLRNIYDKLHLTTRSEVIVWALQCNVA